MKYRDLFNVTVRPEREEREPILGEKSCLQLKDCFEVVWVRDDPQFGHTEEWKAKSLPLSQPCLNELENLRETPGVTVINIDHDKGLYILHCPHPPCW